MNSLLLLLQTISLVFAIVIVYFSFKALNNCSRETTWKARLPLIVTFAGSCGVVLHILMGNVPHWSFTMILVALAVRLASERRESAVRPTNNGHIPRHP